MPAIIANETLDRLDALADAFSGTDEDAATLDTMPEAELWMLAGMMLDRGKHKNAWSDAVAECAAHRRCDRFYERDRQSSTGVIAKWRDFLSLEASTSEGSF